MAITFHPDGRVTGNKITQSGMVLQVINSLNTYPHTFTGTQNTEYTVESASGTSWETSITINQGNKVHAIISLMVGKQGDASGSRSRHLANVRSYGGTYNIEESTANVMITPTISGSTGVIKFQCRVTQRAGGNRNILVNHCEATDAEAAVTVSSLTLLEVVA